MSRFRINPRIRPAVAAKDHRRQRVRTKRTGYPAGDFHPSWGYHGEELLFHTSRYYAHTEAFLRLLSSVPDFSFGTYRAQGLSPAQHQAMERLLRRPAGHVTGRAVVALMNRMTTCGGARPLRTRQRPRVGRRLPEPLPLQHRHPAGLSTADPFLNIAARFGLSVRRRGRHFWVSFSALRSLLDAPNPALRAAVQESIELLHDGGYHLHRRRPG